jgi:hypothetical protein
MAGSRGRLRDGKGGCGARRALEVLASCMGEKPCCSASKIVLAPIIFFFTGKWRAAEPCGLSLAGPAEPPQLPRPGAPKALGAKPRLLAAAGDRILAPPPQLRHHLLAWPPPLQCSKVEALTRRSAGSSALPPQRPRPPVPPAAGAPPPTAANSRGSAPSAFGAPRLPSDSAAPARSARTSDQSGVPWKETLPQGFLEGGALTTFFGHERPMGCTDTPPQFVCVD